MTMHDEGETTKRRTSPFKNPRWWVALIPVCLIGLAACIFAAMMACGRLAEWTDEKMVEKSLIPLSAWTWPDRATVGEPTKRAWGEVCLLAVIVTLAIVLASIVGLWINKVWK